MLDVRVPLFQLVACLSDAVDLVAPEVTNHHKAVAYIAVCVAERLGFSARQTSDLVLAGLLHDIGALPTDARLRASKAEVDDERVHAARGRALLSMFPPLRTAAEIVGRHHGGWKGAAADGDTLLASQVLQLADNAASLLVPRVQPLRQAELVRGCVLQYADREVSADVAEAFRAAAASEAFWLTAAGGPPNALLRRLHRALADEVDLGVRGLIEISRVFAHVIDFRSHFTATHSSGVAACAAALAGYAGFSPRQCLLMQVAGNLHDLGKLAVPSEVLEKADGLTQEDLQVVRAHTYYTWSVLENVPALRTLNEWAAFHHERLDGTGYPFRLTGDDLGLGSRVMAVADVLTAVTEDRPYRVGMDEDRALRVLRQMAQSGALDQSVVDLAAAHFQSLVEVRCGAQREAGAAYSALLDIRTVPGDPTAPGPVAADGRDRERPLTPVTPSLPRALQTRGQAFL